MTHIFNILTVILLVMAGLVVMSYGFVWYEAANNNPALLDNRFSPKRIWLGSRLIIGEFLSMCITAIFYPTGWIRLPDKSLFATGTPTLLLHGLFQNKACWLVFMLRLRLHGVRDLHTLNLPLWKDIEALTELVAKRVDEFRHARGIEKVNLVGHSLGGIIARNYIQARGGARKVEHCILLGAPNTGSKLVPYSISRLGRNLMPGSAFLNNLNALPLPKSVKVHNIYSRHDNLVLPFESARLADSDEHELSGIGHIALLFSGRACRIAAGILRGESHDNP